MPANPAKPLHVRVAEALGWGLTADGASWISPPPSEGRYDAAACGDSIPPRYDTDWSATGPLIEKCKMWIAPFDDRGYGHWTAKTATQDMPEGHPTILLAVCHLILALKEAGKL